jgi:hypothetical protein
MHRFSITPTRTRSIRIISHRKRSQSAIHTPLYRFRPVLAIVSVRSKVFIYTKSLFFSGQKFALMEEKTVLAWIFRRFRLSSPVAFEDNCFLPEIIMKPKMGFPVVLSCREEKFAKN